MCSEWLRKALREAGELTGSGRLEDWLGEGVVEKWVWKIGGGRVRTGQGENETAHGSGTQGAQKKGVGDGEGHTQGSLGRVSGSFPSFS